VNRVLLPSTSKQADTPAVAPAAVSRGRALASEVCACSRTVRSTGGARAVVDVSGIVLQIAAPKCAICWTTYAGLVNASWFAAETVNPLWLTFATLTLILSLIVGLQRALQTRRIAPIMGIATAWVLLVAGWFVGMSPVRHAGFALLFVCYATSARIRFRATNSKEI
jgi:hypothetical protein